MFSLKWNGINVKEQLNLEKLWKAADPEKISTAVSQQVALVGSWREKYFYSHREKHRGCWYTDGGNDMLSDNHTIAYQVSFELFC